MVLGITLCRCFRNHQCSPEIDIKGGQRAACSPKRVTMPPEWTIGPPRDDISDAVPMARRPRFDQATAVDILAHAPSDLIGGWTELLHEPVSVESREPAPFFPNLPITKQHCGPERSRGIVAQSAQAVSPRGCRRDCYGRGEISEARLSAKWASSRSAWAQNSLQTNWLPTGKACTSLSLKQNGSWQYAQRFGNVPTGLDCITVSSLRA